VVKGGVEMRENNDEIVVDLNNNNAKFELSILKIQQRLTVVAFIMGRLKATRCLF